MSESAGGPKPIIIHVSRSFPFALNVVYEWLTDIQDDDVQRTSAVLTSRKVVERSEKHVVYEGRTEVLGRAGHARTEVEFLPPDKWIAHITEGPRTGSWTDYALTPEGTGTRLDVRYHFVFVEAKTNRLVRFLKPLVRRALVRMWQGFEADMKRDLAS